MNETSLPSFALRLRGSRVLQSLTVQEEPETYGLLPPRSSFGSPGTLGSLTPGSPYRFFSKQQSLSSLALRRHLSVSLLRLPQPGPSHVDHDPTRIVPRVSFPALQHFRNQEPFFSLPGSPEAAWDLYPDPKKSHPRVWLPSR
jgi:hypothetical protein